MANERDFYFPLSNDAEDIDSTLNELIGIKDEENDGKVVKIEYDAEGEVARFIAGEVEDSQTIDVDVNEIPVGDGNDWVKSSDWYSQKSITKYEFNEDIYFYFSSSSNVESLTIENFEYEIDGEKEEFLTEENILKMRQGDPQDSSGTPRYEYSIYEFTEEDKNIVDNLFSNGRILNDFNYYISRYDQFPQDDRWGITESYFLKLYEDGNKKKLLIQKFNYLNPSMELIPINSNYDFFFCFRPYENEKLYLAFDKETKIQYFLPPKSFSMTIAPNTTEEIEFSIYTIDETRYFGSKFENDESYYGPQIVFGSDPKGIKGFNNSCNLTLKQKAKIIAEDNSFTHICGSSNIDIRDNTEIITRHNPKVLLTGNSEIVIGEHTYTTKRKTYDGITEETYISDTPGSGAEKIIIGEDAYISIVGAPLLEMKDNANIVMEDHSWIGMDGQSRIDMDGSVTFAMHGSNPISSSVSEPVASILTADGYRLIFSAQEGFSNNRRMDPRFQMLSNLGKIDYKDAPYDNTLNKHYPVRDSIYYWNDFASSVSDSEYLIASAGLLGNSIVFCYARGDYGGWDSLIQRYVYDFTEINNRLASMHLSQVYTVNCYFFISDYYKTEIMNYLNNNPSVKAELQEFCDREYNYLTFEEYCILCYDNNCQFNVTDYCCSLNPINPYVSSNDAVRADIAQLNTLEDFNISIVNNSYIIDRNNSYNQRYVYSNNYDINNNNQFKYFNYFDYTHLYYTSNIDSYFNSIYYQTIFRGPYDPSNQNSGFAYNPLVKQVEQSKINTSYKQTAFVISGPNTSFFMEGDSSSKELVQIGSHGGKIHLDITAGNDSTTNLKFGANTDGKLQCYLTGDDMFIEHADNTHTEMHDDSIFIMKGRRSGSEDGYGDIGHLNKNWTTPMQNGNDSPVLQLYDSSSFSMYGRRGQSNATTRCESNIETLTILLEQPSLYYLSNQSEYSAAATFLEANKTSQQTSQNVFITDKNTALSLIDLIYQYYQDQYNTKGTVSEFQTKLSNMARNLIEFSDQEESYNSNPIIPNSAKKCLFKLTKTDKVEGTGYSNQYYYKFIFSIQYLLYGSESDPRMVKISNSPLCEIADDSEFRMWDNSLIKVDQLNGIKITNDSNPSQNTTPVSISVEPATNQGDQTITISDGVDSITFSIAQLKTALNIQPVGNNLF